MSDTGVSGGGARDLMASRLLLSRIVGKASGRGVCWNLCRLLELLAPEEAEIVRPGELGGWPAAGVPYRNCGLSATEIDRAWRQVVKTDMPLLPDEVLEAFVPRTLWPVLESVIEDGPELAFSVVEDLLRELADGEEDTE